MENLHNSTIELLKKQNPYLKLSATDIVIQSVKSLLINDQLSIGDRLPNEMEIAESLSVSRGSVREAMKILSAMGVVDIRRGDGTYIADNVEYSMIEQLMLQIVKKERNTDELSQIRELIERGIIHLGVDHATEEQIQAMRNCVAKQEEFVAAGAFDYEHLHASEVCFHEAMVNAANNETLKMIYMYILELYLPARYHTVDYEDHMKEALRVHPPVIEAIANRDHTAGEEAIRETTLQWKRLLGRKDDE